MVVAGGEKIGKAEGEKEKINTASTLFLLHGKRGDLLWGDDDLCQGPSECARDEGVCQ